ncbi:MAG: TolC family outer membrane protein [Alphaproteobacteria bacterium]|nr:TolC family outer membrane protein [Alphaproteobacteria bacterium]
MTLYAHKRALGLRALLLAGTAAAVFAGTPLHAETLPEALGLAYQNNPTLQAARAQLRSVDESVPLALSGWRPSLTVNGNVTRARNESQITRGGAAGALFGGGTTLRTSEQAAVSLRQPVFRGLKTIAGTSQARAQVMAQRARLQSTEAQVLLESTSAYLDVLRDQAVLDLQINNVQVLNRQLEATRDRFRVGEITRTDVAQAEARVSGANASRIQAEGQLQKSRANYENNVGKPPEALTQPGTVTGLPGTIDEAIDVAIKSNPNFVAADFTAQAAQDGIDVSRGDLLPTFDIEAQYARGYDTLADKSTSTNAQARAVVTVPLYQSGAEYARLRQSKHTAGQRRLEADQARLDARETTTSAWENYQAFTASIDSIKAQITASEIALEGVQREAEVGSRTVLDVLDAEQELLNARVNLVRAQRDQMVAAYQLLSAMGRLNAETLGLAVAVYDPLDHFDDVERQAFGSSTDADRDAGLK